MGRTGTGAGYVPGDHATLQSMRQAETECQQHTAGHKRPRGSDYISGSKEGAADLRPMTRGHAERREFAGQT